MPLSPRRRLWRVNSADFCPVSREAEAASLQPLYEFVREALEPVDQAEAAWKRPVLLVDDLSVLLGLGVRAAAVLDFVHYCRAYVCCRLQVPRPRQAPPSLARVICWLMAWGWAFLWQAQESFGLSAPRTRQC